MSTTTGTVHHFTVEAITNPQWRGQWMTRCLCGWHTVSVVESLAITAGTQHVQTAGKD